MTRVVDLWRRGGGSKEDALIVPTAATLPAAVTRRVLLASVVVFGVGVGVSVVFRDTSGWAASGVVAAALALGLLALGVTRSMGGQERFVIGVAAVVGAGVGTNLEQDRWTWPYQVPLFAFVVLLPFLVRWTGRDTEPGSR